MIIDLDNKASWPKNVYDIVDRWAKHCAGSTAYTSDIPLELEYDKDFRELLSGYLIRGYHCTRLLPHEVHLVEDAGLRPLTAELLNDRINAALGVGIISPIESDLMKSAHVFAAGDNENRENQVCLVLSKKTFRNNLSGCEPLLGSWGGEGIYLSSKLSVLDRLTSKSKPTIIAALLDLSGRNSPHNVFPALHKVFVGSALNLSDVGADVFYKAAIPPERIERIHQPGDSVYEALGDMPNS